MNIEPDNLSRVPFTIENIQLKLGLFLNGYG